MGRWSWSRRGDRARAALSAMDGAAAPTILLVVGFQENPDDPTDVSALVVQSDERGEPVPPEQAISQAALDSLISAGTMPVRVRMPPAEHPPAARYAAAAAMLLARPSLTS
jgi:hypothetical protein